MAPAWLAERAVCAWLAVGARLFFGGGPMRMGGYGALDPMTASMRPPEGFASAEVAPAAKSPPEHHEH